jgi:hypothetical protein
MSNILKNHFAKVVHGKVEFSDVDGWKADVKRHEGKAVFVTVERLFRQRSVLQNKYYWSVIVPYIMDWTGFDKDEAHIALKMKFLSIEKNGILSAKSTADLSTVEFSDYNERIKVWAAEQGVYIPDPNEVTTKGEVYIER